MTFFPRASSGKSGVDQLHPTMLCCLHQGDLSKVVLEGLLLCIKNLKISNPSDPKSCKFLSLKHEIFYFNPSFFLFCKMAKKTDKKKGRSAINEVVTREYTINVHKRIHGM